MKSFTKRGWAKVVKVHCMSVISFFKLSVRCEFGSHRVRVGQIKQHTSSIAPSSLCSELSEKGKYMYVQFLGHLTLISVGVFKAKQLGVWLMQVLPWGLTLMYYKLIATRFARWRKKKSNDILIIQVPNKEQFTQHYSLGWIWGFLQVPHISGDEIFTIIS